MDTMLQPSSDDKGGDDTEVFCADCFAGLESSEHHEKCVAPLDDDDCGHHSWTGLMALLDEHWPADIFPAEEDDTARDAGARIVSLLRWVDRLKRAPIPWNDEHTPYRYRKTGDACCRVCLYSWPCPTIRGDDLD